MRIYVLIPVHNRVEKTKQCVLDLIAQDFDGDIEIGGQNVLKLR